MPWFRFMTVEPWLDWADLCPAQYTRLVPAHCPLFVPGTNPPDCAWHQRK
ncbi:hypothetical protein HP456_01830 [Bacillus haikouensis]|nr:hypothetical protein [Bacillus haikouensis]NQD64663.1 hypothetical protein [Bacillus haikouensis]